MWYLPRDSWTAEESLERDLQTTLTPFSENITVPTDQVPEEELSIEESLARREVHKFFFFH